MGINGMYLNVRDLGPGGAGTSLPLHFDSSQFEPSSFEGGLRRQAAVDVSSDHERFRVTAVSGGDDPPAQRYLDQLNEMLASLSLTAYSPAPVAAASGDPISGFGLHASVPSGWEGGIARGEVHAGDQLIDLTITEFSSPDAASFVTGRMPLTIGPTEFVHLQDGTGYETGRSFLDCRARVPALGALARPVTCGTGTRAGERLPRELPRRAGRLLPRHRRSRRLRAGGGMGHGLDGPGRDPAGRAANDVVGLHGALPRLGPPVPAERDARCASSRRDRADGQARPARERRRPALEPPFRLGDFREASFEGLGAENDPRSFRGRYGDYDVEIWALFGREHPTPEQLARAQAELDRLQLPDWPSWTTSAAR